MKSKIYSLIISLFHTLLGYIFLVNFVYYKFLYLYEFRGYLSTTLFVVLNIIAVSPILTFILDYFVTEKRYLSAFLTAINIVSISIVNAVITYSVNLFFTVIQFLILIFSAYIFLRQSRGQRLAVFLSMLIISFISFSASSYIFGMDHYNPGEKYFRIKYALTDMCSNEDIRNISENRCINPVKFRIGRPYNFAVSKNSDVVVFDRMNGIYSINGNGDITESGLPAEYSFTANITYNTLKDEIVFANHYEEMFVMRASDMQIIHKSSLPWKDIFDFDDGFVTTEYDINEYWLGAGHGKRIVRYDTRDYRYKGYLNIDYDKITGAYLRWHRTGKDSLVLLTELGIYKLARNGREDYYTVADKKFYPSFFHEIYSSTESRQIFFSNFLLNRVERIGFDDPFRITSFYSGKGPRWLIYDDTASLLYVSNYSERNVTIIDTKRNIILKHIMVGPRPRGIGKDPVTGKIIVVSGCGVFEIKPTDECMKAKWEE